MDYAEINVDHKFHRHLIGKNGANSKWDIFLILSMLRHSWDGFVCECLGRLNSGGITLLCLGGIFFFFFWLKNRLSLWGFFEIALCELHFIRQLAEVFLVSFSPQKRIWI